MASHGIPRALTGARDTAEARRLELKRIEEYKELEKTVHERMSREDCSEDTLSITSKLLTWNPEYYTIWNHRRRILRHLLNHVSSRKIDLPGTESKTSTEHSATMISNDLIFLMPLLRKFPKCYWIWNYRLWLLEESIRVISKPQARTFWDQELALTSKMLGLDSRNFIGWGYRRTVVASLESPFLQLEETPPSLAEQEFEYTTKMIKTNLSNFSAWHYRSKLILRLLEERSADHHARRKFLDDELELIQRALWAGGTDQSLWFYHQHLMSTFDPQYRSQSMAPDLSQDECIEYVIAETDKIMDMVDGAEDCKYIYQALINMCIQYKNLCSKWPPQVDHLPEWLSALEHLDPLRAGRWKDLREKLPKV
ncbi:MAG: hypothetical protein Q9163_000325 [Psora crenata]